MHRDGVYVASRYYVGASMHGAHYLVYDRRWDKFDACRTSGAITPEASDLVGETGPLEKARYQAMARLRLIWALEALYLAPSECRATPNRAVFWPRGGRATCRSLWPTIGHFGS